MTESRRCVVVVVVVADPQSRVADGDQERRFARSNSHCENEKEKSNWNRGHRGTLKYSQKEKKGRSGHARLLLHDSTIISILISPSWFRIKIAPAMDGDRNGETSAGASIDILTRPPRRRVLRSRSITNIPHLLSTRRLRRLSYLQYILAPKPRRKSKQKCPNQKKKKIPLARYLLPHPTSNIHTLDPISLHLPHPNATSKKQII